MKNFKHAAKFKEFYSEYPSTYQVDSTTNILYLFFYNFSIQQPV